MGQHQNDVRQHILDTSKALILGKGFTAVGLSEVLTTAGVPKGSFYYYFESKEQFGQELLEHYFIGYLESLDTLLRPDGSPARERFMRYWRRWMDLQEQGRCHGQCLVVKLGAEVSDLSEAMRMALHRGTDRIIARLAACVAEGAADGSLPGLDPPGVAQTLYELWLGASLLTKVRRDASALAAAMATTTTFLNRT
jgi:TetR/AcrR family transcriptional repressor of nem operon